MVFGDELAIDAGIPVCNYHNDIDSMWIWVESESVVQYSSDMQQGLWDRAATRDEIEYDIDGVSNLSITEFTQLFSQPDSCLQTLPLDQWVKFAPTPTPTPGAVCNFTPNASTELVTAIQDANGTPEPDTICLATSATYPFTSAHIPLNALPAITSDITICSTEGATLTRQAGSPLFGFFEVSAGGNLTLDNLTLNGGDVGNDTGGALVNEGGTVTLNNVTFSNNHANTGGAIDNESGSLTITDSTFENNLADYGGAIDNDTGGTLSISGSAFTSNTAALDGGAIHNDGGTLTVTDSTFTSNTAGRYGGALDNTGSATISGSTFSGNSASWSGGAIRNSQSLTITDSVFSGNSTSSRGGRIYNAGGGSFVAGKTGDDPPH